MTWNVSDCFFCCVFTWFKWDCFVGLKVSCFYCFWFGFYGCVLYSYDHLMYLFNKLSCLSKQNVSDCFHLHVIVFRIEKVRLNRKDGISKVIGTILCVAGASVITLYKGPTIFSPAPSLNRPTPMFVSLGDAKGKNWTLGCLYLIGHCLSWSGWLVLQAPILKKYPARLSVTSYTCFFGLIQFLIIAAFLERDPQAWIFHSGGELFTILYAVSISSVLQSNHSQKFLLF